MNEEVQRVYGRVGPVLQTCAVSDAIVAAIKDLNQDVLVMDRGAYLRVLVPSKCFVTRSAIERRLGRSFRFPGELEVVMPSFKGAIVFTESDVTWQFREPSDRAQVRAEG
jgi:toluene monooxygenase system protein D